MKSFLPRFSCRLILPTDSTDSTDSRTIYCFILLDGCICLRGVLDKSPIQIARLN